MLSSLGSIKMPVVSETIKCIVLGGVLLITAMILHVMASRFMEGTLEKKMINVHAADDIYRATATQLIGETGPNFRCLRSQFEVSQKLKMYYLDIAKIYYKNFYAFTVCSIVFGTVLAIAAFLLINKGWQNATALEKSFFLVSVFISSSYFLLSNVFNNGQNYSLNLTKVKAFHQIQMNILSFTTKPYVNMADSVTAELDRNFKDIAYHFDLQTIQIDTEKLGGSPQEILKSVQRP